MPFFILLFILFTLTGCVLSPGMAPPTEQSASGSGVAAEIVEISPKIIQEQMQEKKAVIAEPSADMVTIKEYQVNAFDTLAITIWDHPELTTPAGANPPPQLLGNIVRSDGTIFYPYVGVIHVAGKTVEEIRLLLTKRLTSYIENPQVDVRIADYRSQLVYVTGEVGKPSTIAVTNRPLSLVDAINQAGGTKISSDLKHVSLIHSDGTQESIDLAQLQMQGKLSNNRFLKAGDHVFVPNNENDIVFVTGEVVTPGSKVIGYQRYTIAKALSAAGGVDMRTSNPSQIYVLRGIKKTESNQSALSTVKIYHLDANTPTGLILGDQFELQAHDVVFVSSAEVVRWGRVMDNFAETIQTITAARLYQIRK